MRDYVAQDWVDHTDETFFAGIVKLPPAHSLTFDRDGLRLAALLAARAARSAGGDPVGAVRELFVDSVRLRLRSDVPRRHVPLRRASTRRRSPCVDRPPASGRRPRTRVRSASGSRRSRSYFDDPALDERPFARAVVARTQAAPHWVSFGRGARGQRCRRIVEAQDEPFGSTSIVAPVVRHARGGAGGPQGGARRPGRRRGARRLPRRTSAPASPTCCARAECASSARELAALPASHGAGVARRDARTALPARGARGAAARAAQRRRRRCCTRACAAPDAGPSSTAARSRTGCGR